jgi:hypothetical protein
MVGYLPERLGKTPVFDISILIVERSGVWLAVTIDKASN